MCSFKLCMKSAVNLRLILPASERGALQGEERRMFDCV